MDIFTCELVYNRKAKELAIPVTLRCSDCGKPGHKLIDCVGIIDTGATSSMLSEVVAEELQLYPCGEISVSGVHGADNSNLYFVDIVFGSGYTLSNHRVSGASGNAGFDLLIGMDILSLGELHLVSVHGNSVFRFGIPSLSDKTAQVSAPSW